ncbi:MAG: futalosine hydrolase [Planctomycetota bacterium]|nr:futalosine hydrolase [Planctomycetota bacterium]
MEPPTISRLLDPYLHDRPVLVAVAAPREVEAVLAGLDRAGVDIPEPWSVRDCGRGIRVVHTGVGKANAAGAVARALAAERFAAVLCVGLAGALPCRDPLAVGQTLLADACVLADEGLGTSGGFQSLSELGFPSTKTHGERFACDPDLRGALDILADRIGLCATVSTCSGTDKMAASIAARTGALVEDMESAAVGLVASRFGVPFGCLRVVSNRTGDRGQQDWDLDGALSVVTRIAAALSPGRAA